ncbi:MAG: triphosphoribosyl-dephospho-CoA synthase [Planctomycetota bacterium]
MASIDTTLSIGRIASMACLLEVCASKPGNVHRGADFPDMSLNDFVVSAELVGQAIDSRKTDDLGLLILNSVKATRSLVSTNTNLGIILLLCPLAIVANDGDLSASALRKLIKNSTAEDAATIYEAIRIARPGGLREVDKLDISEEPPHSILDAMSQSSDHDQIAQQYTNGFEQIFSDVVPLLEIGQQQFDSINESIIYAHVSMLARYGDSLIKRKCGQEASDHARMMACKALEPLINRDREGYHSGVAELDFWLRSDGNSRNPGTTADLITAGIFVGIINEHLTAPFN